MRFELAAQCQESDLLFNNGDSLLLAAKRS